MAIANITGNILTDSGIATSSLLPYTGATANVNLGTYGLKAGSITTEGGYNFKILASGTLFENGYSVLSSVAGNVSITQAISAGNLKTFTFDFSAWATNTSRTYTLPDITGTLALLEGTQTFSGSKTFSVTTIQDAGIVLKDGVYPSPPTGYVGFASNGVGITIVRRSGVTSYNNNFQFPLASNDYNFPNATGTLALTSDLSAYLPLTGGTLTGALNGTSATFSSSVEAVGYRATSSSAFGGTGVGTEIGYSGGLGYIQAYNRGTSTYTPIKVDGSTVSLQISGVEKLGIASTGAATFSSSVTIGGDLALTPTDSAIAFSSGAGRFFTGGAERMRITSSGNVGIGTSSPVGLLHLNSSGSTNFYIQSGAGNSAVMRYFIGTSEAVTTRSDSSGNYQIETGLGSPTERMRITSGGAVNIGTSTNAYGTLAIKSNNTLTYGGINVYANGNDRFIALQHTGSVGVIETENAGSGVMTDMTFRTGGSERMRITSGGIINTTSRLNVNGAGDNSLFSLINNGTTYTLGFSPNATASTSTTLTITTATTTWVYNGTGTATWTLPNPSGTNQMFWIKNAGTGVLTLNAFSGTNIINNSATAVSSITIAVGATALIQQDGNVKSYQLQ